MSFYAVKKGKQPGIYKTWDEAKLQVNGFNYPVYKKFETIDAATNFMNSDAPKHFETRKITDFFKPDHDPQENEKTLICFTDGSAINNGYANAKASYAVVWPYHEEFNGAGLVHPATNNRGEYTALIKAFETADEIDHECTKTLIAYTDSMLLVNSLTKWLPGWKKNDYKKSDGGPVANLDLLQILEACMLKRHLVLRHVRAHQTTNTWESNYNNIVDQLARGVTGGKN